MGGGAPHHGDSAGGKPTFSAPPPFAVSSTEAAKSGERNVRSGLDYPISLALSGSRLLDYLLISLTLTPAPY